MIDSRFYSTKPDQTIASLLNALPEKEKSQIICEHTETHVKSVSTLANATQDEMAFLDNPKYAEQCSESNASIIIISPNNIKYLPENAIAIITSQPYRHYAMLASLLIQPKNSTVDYEQKNGAFIAKTAKIHETAIIYPNVVIDDGVEIGKNVVIEPNTYIGAYCAIGNGSYIESNCSVNFAFLGDYIRLYAGAKIGQDGFGYALGADKHISVPQLGRVILQDYVHIGANTAIDKGALDDTIIGEGTKIDNLVQIGHNVKIGRHCVIAGQCAIAGSVEIEDYVMIGGQTCISGHLKIHTAARISGGSSVMHNVPAKATWAGVPAKDIKACFREIATLSKLTKKQ
jgi:UDP-3-O-[3-hydroxymyristoyl] glucosamine N-acyltransferase